MMYEKLSFKFQTQYWVLTPPMCVGCCWIQLILSSPKIKIGRR